MIKKNKNGMYEGIVYVRKLNYPGSSEDGYAYVGCTMDEATRKCKWDNPNTSNYGGRKICEAREKYGVKAFSYAVLERHQHSDRDQLRKELEEREAAFIKYYDSVKHGFNESHGGTGFNGMKKTQAMIDKGVATRKANGNYSPSQATRAKISQANRGRHHSAATKAKISAGNKGKVRSAAVRQNLRQRMLGNVPSAATRQKLSQSHMGKTFTMSAQGLANVRAARKKMRKPVTVVDSTDGTETHCSSYTEAAQLINCNPGSIGSALKTKGLIKNRYRIKP